MGRKSKYSAEDKLLILNEVLQNGITNTAAKYKIDRKTIGSWRLLYKYQGLAGLKSSHHNQSYSKEFKCSLVEQYRQLNEQLELFAIKNTVTTMDHPV